MIINVQQLFIEKMEKQIHPDRTTGWKQEKMQSCRVLVEFFSFKKTQTPKTDL